MELNKFGIGSPRSILLLTLYLFSLILVYFFNNLLALFILLIVSIIQYYNNVHDIIMLRKEIDSQIDGWYGQPFEGYNYVTYINDIIQKCKRWLLNIDKQIKSQFAKGLVHCWISVKQLFWNNVKQLLNKNDTKLV